MAEQTSTVGMERKLTAIFSADVAGYSRLMGDDEEATIRTLTAYREVISSVIQQYRGRVVDAPGDNLLAEFASAVDAVRCAVEIQEQLKTKNAELPEQRRMRFRIGINLGDVIVEGERLYGDGVNIAARLESLAEPGGICISGTVYDQVKNKVALGYEYLGEREVKNIAELVRVYRIRVEESSSQESESQKSKSRSPDEVQRNLGKAPPPGLRSAPSRLLPGHRWVVAGFFLIAAAIIAVHYWPAPPPPSQPLTSSPQPLPLPDKPSIVVLPFNNMSGDPAQEYFSDGMTDTLITDLSKISALFIIARNSAFTYKGQAVEIGQVSKRLGVRYVVEGSVQKAGDQVRINIQLVDALTGGNVWTERYDRKLTDIFALQDEIIHHIVAALQVTLTPEEQGRALQRSTNSMEAYDLYLRGDTHFWRGTQEANIQARSLYERAIERDPQFAMACVKLAWTYFREMYFHWNHEGNPLQRTVELAEQAALLDNMLPQVHEIMGELYLLKDRDYERAIAELRQAVALDVNFAAGYVTLGDILAYAGQPEEAIALVQKAVRLNPQHQNYFTLYTLGHAYRLTDRLEEALEAQKSALLLSPGALYPHTELAVLYVETNREKEAQKIATEILRLSPNFSVEEERKGRPYKDPNVLARYIAALRKAGLK